jgi:hypothetical protein
MTLARTALCLAMIAAACSAPPVADNGLRAELIARAAADQAEMLALVKKGNAPEHRGALQRTLNGNARWLDSVITQRGWPVFVRADSADSAAAEAAFLIAQHADSLPDAQARFLSALRTAFQSHRTLGHHLAYLEDRVRKAQHRPQLYGTQVAYDSTGNAVRAEVESPDSLDMRRASVGLPTMAAYLDQMRALNTQLRAMAPPKEPRK